MSDINDFIRMLIENSDGDLPEDIKEQLNNKRAAIQLTQSDLESEYANRQSELMEIRVQADKADVEAKIAKYQLQKVRRGFTSLLIMLGSLVGIYLAVVGCVLATRLL